MVENIQDKSGKGSDGVKADDHVNLVAFQPEHSSAIFGSGHGGKDRQRDEYVVTARYGFDLYRPESLVTVVTDTDQVYA